MLAVKGCDGSGVVRLPIPSAQVRMTLGTGGVCRGLQQHGAFVLDVAGCAFWSEGLIGMMQRCVMTSEASFVSDVGGECSRLGYVTESALLREYGMRVREWSGRVHFLAALRALRDEPRQCNCGNRDRQPETPSPKRVRAREVLQINALGEFLGCSRASQHL